MKLSFSIDYHAVWGEQLYLTGNIAELGDFDFGRALRMENKGGSLWAQEIEVSKAPASINYRYIIKNDAGQITRGENGVDHVLSVAPATVRSRAKMRVYDSWHEKGDETPYFSSAFTDCICNRGANRDKADTLKSGMVVLSVIAPTVKPDETLAICGGIDSLGNWDPKKAQRLNDSQFPMWSVALDLKKIRNPFAYKFIIVNRETSELVAWEWGDNRIFDFDLSEASSLVIECGNLRNPAAPWRCAGTAIPIFSIRSDEDFGVGDFYDLKKMVDWAALTGQKFIQVLPINDTTMTGTWTDSYPYNANSTFALHPMYLRLQAMGRLKDAKARHRFDNLRKELNDLKEIDYERVNNAKNEYTHLLFQQDKAVVVTEKAFKEFVIRNESWLKPYAAFCVLRDKNHTPDFSKWGKFSVYDEKKIDKFIIDNADDINYVYYIQYHLDRQLSEMRAYAHLRGVAIKGDIPIGISRTSVDAWISPRLFNLDCQAGAPPDDFSVLGQNWGFPTYNWEEMSRDGFAWWKARFRKMSEYFDAYRIDHVLGFFRIWQIPMNAVHGLLGIFNKALPFTPAEMRDSFGFYFNAYYHTTPYIYDYFLGDFFGEYTQEAKDRFLTQNGDGRYRFIDDFNTQRKVVDYFASQPDDDKNRRLRDGLLGLHDEVLFIEDPDERGKYHPRISAQFTYSYRSLGNFERNCFDRLYNHFFYQRHNDFWRGKAMWKLPPLTSETKMLVCAEDLGMIPECVGSVMDELKILSLEIQRMPKDPKVEFGNPHYYPYRSVCTTSTHDMGGIRQWWEEDREKTQHYFNNMLHEGGAAPFFAEPWICERIVNQHLVSPAMLTILPLQDWMSVDGDIRREDPREEQINVPANPRHYWRYRMHITVEQLLASDKFNDHIRSLIKASGR